MLEAYELHRHLAVTLMKLLEEGVLAVSSHRSEYDRTGGIRSRLSVALHIKLLQVGSKISQGT